jgi:hypothetical protein
LTPQPGQQIDTAKILDILVTTFEAHSHLAFKTAGIIDGAAGYLYCLLKVEKEIWKSLDEDQSTKLLTTLYKMITRTVNSIKEKFMAQTTL